MTSLKINLRTVDNTYEKKQLEVSQVPRVGEVITVKDVSVGRYFIVWDVVWELDTNTAIVEAEHTTHLPEDNAEDRRRIILQHHGFSDDMAARV